MPDLIITIREPHKNIEVVSVAPDGSRQRRAYDPGVNLVELGAPVEVQDAAAEHWTQDVIAAFAARRAAQEAGEMTPAERRAVSIREACRRRILAVADELAQINLASAAGAGLLGADDLATYRAGLGWVAAMRKACGGLIADADADHLSDESWPEVPPGVEELTRRF